MGIPLARWGHGFTILLEKIMRNNYIHRLRAICLFEADFNLWNKLTFAKRMMKLTGEKGCIPDDLFAKKLSDCHNATIEKVFFMDL